MVETAIGVCFCRLNRVRWNSMNNCAESCGGGPRACSRLIEPTLVTLHIAIQTQLGTIVESENGGIGGTLPRQMNNITRDPIRQQQQRTTERERQEQAQYCAERDCDDFSHRSQSSCDSFRLLELTL